MYVYVCVYVYIYRYVQEILLGSLQQFDFLLSFEASANRLVRSVRSLGW